MVYEIAQRMCKGAAKMLPGVAQTQGDLKKSQQREAALRSGKASKVGECDEDVQK